MKFSSFVVKVASRCNLNCDYCYMYQHADQSWKNKPRFLSSEHQELFAERLREYAEEKEVESVVIIYHGGEPLLFGVDRLVKFSRTIRNALEGVCKPNFGIQTNGVLLKEPHLEIFQQEGISVSLSIDGPKEIHDLHRLDHKGRPSFDKVYTTLKLLQRFPEVFQGCISVINPYTDPRKILQFFDENGVQEFNMLIPDANYVTLPEGRDRNPNLYKDWLINAFDVWFDEFPHLKFKYFDWILQAILGNASPTDSFGLGDISLLVLETDGTYHDHDVLKITEENSSALGLDVVHNKIVEAERAEKILYHSKLLTKAGLSETCQKCPHVDVCGGGFVAHRFSEEGYQNPSIYCDEIYALIDHITLRLIEKVKKESKLELVPVLQEFSSEEMGQFWEAATAPPYIEKLQDHVARKNYQKLKSSIPYALENFPSERAEIERCEKLTYAQLKSALLEPATYAWLRALYGHRYDTPATNIAGETLPADSTYFRRLLQLTSEPAKGGLTIQSNDRWFRLVMGKGISLDHPPEVFRAGVDNLKRALEILKDVEPESYNAIPLISPHILLIKDRNASPEKDVSLSDDTIPGAIFLGVWKGEGLLSHYMVGASIIHEHLHQKLYLLQNRFELFESEEVRVFSPWPSVERPPNGALHAVYVFTHVAAYWSKLLEVPEAHALAEEQLHRELERLGPCIAEIDEKVPFTRSGRLFFDLIVEKFAALEEKFGLATWV